MFLKNEDSIMSSNPINEEGRAVSVERGRLLEYLTLGWNLLEGLIAVGSGVVAGSIALVGFGVDSFIESLSGAALLWRLHLDDLERRERAEAMALRDCPRQLFGPRCVCRLRRSQVFHFS